MDSLFIGSCHELIFGLSQTEPFGGRLLGFARTWWQYLVDVSQGTAAQYHSSHSIYYGLSVYNSCQERNLNASLHCKGYIFVGVTISNSCQKSVCCHLFLICASTIVLPCRKGTDQTRSYVALLKSSSFGTENKPSNVC
ncbi:hypothetical protein L3X38_010581 [Prunus dulcis]|uniref:Uncharacterized protein n=1 Tax=Prunus dulcis TaxID=3755 RepID=A0AAD4WFW6_PRUDU|nr:hypothetical protein L3X38_010581 [Prunus dulcis]